MTNCENQSHACCAERGSSEPLTSDVVSGPAARGVMACLRLYQRRISPLLPPACRFYPTCSEYALQSVAKYGLARGAWLALRRLCRCHPLHPGGYDPVR
jgi:putative membrane protein insertion efficiency factor